MTASPEQNSTKSKKLKSKNIGAQLKHLLIDVDFFEKPKIKALQFDYGHDGVVLFIAILCDMSKATNGELPDSCIKQSAKNYDLKGKTVDEFIQYLITYDLIHRCENPLYVANRRVIEDQIRMKERQDKWRTTKRVQRVSDRTTRGHVKNEEGRMKNENMNTEDKKIENKKLHKQHVWLSDAELVKFQTELGDEVTQRCIEKLDAWIESDPTIKKKKNGRNAAACFRSWVINSIAEEQARAGRLNGNQGKGKSMDPRINVILNSLGE